jgi:tRNA(Arg) A34 adenosine deaminase TadA
MDQRTGLAKSRRHRFVYFCRDIGNDVRVNRAALQESQTAANENEVSVGAVIVPANGRAIASDHNLCEQLHAPTAHTGMFRYE